MKGILYIWGLAMLAFVSRGEPISCEVVRAENRLFSTPAPATGVKRVLWYTLSFPDDDRTPLAAPAAEKLMQQVNQRLQRISYARLSLTWNISPALQLPHEAAYYTGRWSDFVNDARQSAANAGINYLDYDLDFFEPPAVPGWNTGLALIGGRWIYTAPSSVGIILHEFGHAMGLPHANQLDNSRPNPKQLTSPPFPSNIGNITTTYPFDINSLVGRPGIMNLGQTLEYGDRSDVMGTSADGDDFNFNYKRRLGWLDDRNIALIASDGTFRLYAPSAGVLRPDRSYSLCISNILLGRFSDAASRQYWIEISPQLSNAVQLRWCDLADQKSSLLIDANPALPSRFFQPALNLGKTFVDPGLGIAMTVVAAGGKGEDHWIDLTVATTTASNHPPILTVRTGLTHIAPAQIESFSAEASDPDGDSVSVYWDLTESINASGNTASRSWLAAGEYLVRCEASDRRGGITSTNILIKVGDETMYRITGRVLDTLGKPVSEAFVHNGRINSIAGDRLDFSRAQTDSSGNFVLTGYDPGPYFPGASIYGYRVINRTMQEPVSVPASSQTNIDLIVEPLPRVTVSAPAEAREGGTINITLNRSGVTDQPLSVAWKLSGDASPGADFDQPLDTFIIIPAGSTSATVNIFALSDSLNEAPEKITFQAVVPTRFGRGGVLFSYPGWELRDVAGETKWFQIDPPYVVFANSIASTTIVDADSIRLSVTNKALNISGPTGRSISLEKSSDLVHWETIGSLQLPAAAPLPSLPSLGFFRAQLLP